MANPILESIRSGKAPKPARLAAARGMLPLAPEEIFEALIILTKAPEDDVRTAAEGTLTTFEVGGLLPVAQNPEASLELLSFLADWERSPHNILEALILNKATPNEAIAILAGKSADGSLLEAITINQQRLIQHPAIIEALLVNPARTPEAERRAREVKLEFFEKEIGAAQVVEEQKARARVFSQLLGSDISEDEFQSALSQFELEMGAQIEDNDSGMLDPEAELRRFLHDSQLDGEEVDSTRLSLFQIIARLKVKERIFLGLKGNREARSVLIRDSNKMVSSAVLKNPRITTAEVEGVTKLKGISEELLRIVCMNRAWTSIYTIMHNLACHPRTPLTFSMQYVNRLQLRDLKSLGKNRGVPDVIRNLAIRLVDQRQQ